MNTRYKPWLTIFLTVFILLIATVPALAGSSDSVMELSWREHLANFLTNGVVGTVLLTVGIVGLVIGVATVGGFPLYGCVGIAAFALFFVGNIWAGSMEFAALWMFLGGLVLIAFEVFLTPGFGVPGILGLVSIIGSMFIAAADPLSTVWQMIVALLISAALIWFLLKHRQTRKIWQRLVLVNKSDSASGYDSIDRGYARYVGKRGRALTILRPAGSAEIDGEKIDVVTQGEYISAGAMVEVMLVEGMRIVVREVK